jgi:hypothetical protein
MANARATQRQSAVVLMLKGEVTVPSLQSALAPIEAELQRGARGLLVDVRRATKLDSAARDYFFRWSKERRAQISAMAIVTDKTRYKLLVTALSVVGGRPIRSFAEPIRATAWLNTAG